MTKKFKLYILLVTILFILYLSFFNSDIKTVSEDAGAQNTQTEVSDVQGEEMDNKVVTEEVPGREIIAENLDIPWDIAFLPDQSMLVTERPGNIVRIYPDGSRAHIDFAGATHRGEGGLLGILLHPDFEQNQKIYVYLTTKTLQNETVNNVERYTLRNNELVGKEIIIEGIPGAIYHDGGRMAVGSDGYLYVTAGDATRPDTAQDLNSLGGKLLRVTLDGGIPEDNPFGSEVYSWGHRNAQGIAWDSNGNLWSTEHGRSGVFSGLDEINLIEKGKNYGWPEIEGDKEKEGMETPVLHSTASVTWAPASLIYYKGHLLFGGLRGESLYVAGLDGTRIVSFNQYLEGEYGRIRTIALGPDGLFYITTSNTDARGKVRDGDDKIIRIHPRVFGLE